MQPADTMSPGGYYHIAQSSKPGLILNKKYPVSVSSLIAERALPSSGPGTWLRIPGGVWANSRSGGDEDALVIQRDDQRTASSALLSEAGPGDDGADQRQNTLAIVGASHKV